MAVVHLERITCDNPECAVYVEELIREEPGRYKLVEYVRAQAMLQGLEHEGRARFLSRALTRRFHQLMTAMAQQTLMLLAG